MLRETSLRAYRDLEDSGLLQDQERALMQKVHYLYPYPAHFTRKELKERTGWEWNVISGRCNSLIKKQFLTEYPETRDGGHLLSIAQLKTVAQVPHGVCRADDPNPEAKRMSRIALDSSNKTIAPSAVVRGERGDALSVSDDRHGTGTPAAAATAPVSRRNDGQVNKDELMILDGKERPYYVAVGVGPGWPPDQDHLHRRRG